jgi:hypothetical protein
VSKVRTPINDNGNLNNPTDLRGLARVQHHVTNRVLDAMSKYAQQVKGHQNPKPSVFVEPGTNNVVLQAKWLDIEDRQRLEHLIGEGDPATHDTHDLSAFGVASGDACVEWGGSNWIGKSDDGTDQIYWDTDITTITSWGVTIDAGDADADYRVDAVIDIHQAEAS